ncbi:hypothetical protein AMJ83_05410 [candidate division WOR_3 bacterium SM23_42]|uniref:Peptide deformylase n=1 Tax=candidate division WOR_3 bacterium SM23_42 TaxID=1703779 RepID=A0A0S8FW21_UNCW3|nr:MAG: hypothetical protein AMJ83_05410 [candidate division WOR_3 bacterium SM23_42]
MALSVLKYPASGLRKKAAPVEKIGEEIFNLVEAMIETMLTEDGLGLAANQVGKDSRIFVLNTTPREEQPQSMAFINPVVLHQEGEVKGEEGCLSFPELYLDIARPEKVRIYAKDLYNEGFILDVAGILARAVMHEMDHLNGILFIDHAADTDRENLQKYLAGLAKEVEVREER